MFASVEAENLGSTTPITKPLVPPCGEDLCPEPGSRGDPRRMEDGCLTGKPAPRLPRAQNDLDGQSFPQLNAYGEEIVEEVTRSQIPTLVGQPRDMNTNDWLRLGGALLFSILALKAGRAAWRARGGGAP